MNLHDYCFKLNDYLVYSHDYAGKLHDSSFDQAILEDPDAATLRFDGIFTNSGEIFASFGGILALYKTAFTS